MPRVKNQPPVLMDSITEFDALRKELIGTRFAGVRSSKLRTCYVSGLNYIDNHPARDHFVSLLRTLRAPVPVWSSTIQVVQGSAKAPEAVDFTLTPLKVPSVNRAACAQWIEHWYESVTAHVQPLVEHVGPDVFACALHALTKCKRFTLSVGALSMFVVLTTNQRESHLSISFRFTQPEAPIQVQAASESVAEMLNLPNLTTNHSELMQDIQILSNAALATDEAKMHMRQLIHEAYKAADALAKFEASAARVLACLTASGATLDLADDSPQDIFAHFPFLPEPIPLTCQMLENELSALALHVPRDAIAV